MPVISEKDLNEIGSGVVSVLLSRLLQMNNSHVLILVKVLVLYRGVVRQLLSIHDALRVVQSGQVDPGSSLFLHRLVIRNHFWEAAD